MKNLLKIIALFILSVWQINAQGLSVPSTMGKAHPRVFGKDMSVESVKKIVADKQWAKDIVDKTKQKVDPYVELYKKDNTWLVSRLQMYWKTKSTQVYINGGTFVRADGEAPVPTVKFPGTRNHITDYKQPKLEDIKPYMDDPRGLYLQHKDRPDAWEWTGISKSGNIVETIN